MIFFELEASGQFEFKIANFDIFELRTQEPFVLIFFKFEASRQFWLKNSF